MVRLLLDKGYRPVVFDNLETGHRELLPKSVPFIKGDLRRIEDLRPVFKKNRIDTVMHFAAYIVVPESVRNSLKYYRNNVGGSLNLLTAMREAEVKKIIFSSTAAVYGRPKRVPIREADPAVPANPYGWSKLIVEKILDHIAQADRDFRYLAFRYFNAAGAHPSGRIGEWHEPETHLIPNILKVAAGEHPYLKVTGADLPTPDGTGVRDYVHVLDICRAHLAGLKFLEAKDQGLWSRRSATLNLGGGRGFSVRQVLVRAQRITGRKIPVRTLPRRPGDLPRLLASPARAKDVLGWRPAYSLEEMIQSAWKWQQYRTGI